ncbi:MAG: PH domain-containing protein, partial [Microbacterium gubbeenense]
MPDTEAAPDRADDQGQVQVFARFRPGWVVYNMVAWWGYLMAIGLLWGAFWLASTFGLDLWAVVRDAVDWRALGWFWTSAIGVLAVGLVGVLGLTVNFFTSHWRFELVRAPGEDGTVLRTTQGLLRTREVTRSDSRLRGVSISEPVLWRWMGMADTEVITTGLSIWSGSSTILPRGPISVARPVAARILAAEPNPFTAPLRAHPRRDR